MKVYICLIITALLCTHCSEDILHEQMIPINSKSKSFTMGSSDGRVSEYPPHTVSFTYNFSMSKYEITQEQYLSLLGYNPSVFQTLSRPVERCSWYDAVLFCNELSKRAGLDTIYSYDLIIGRMGDGSRLKNVHIHYTRDGYRLPTEAEWEFACRGDSKGDYHWGSNHKDANLYSWHWHNSDTLTQSVGQKKPNSFGLYDMSGNVWEWCNDWYDLKSYTSSPTVNPVGISQSDVRVIRGGSWRNEADPFFRITDRGFWMPHLRNYLTGFRVVRGAIPQ